jgi:anionic cell wall polymer biosynthesis LytR-Cps2A-Psr (LCP) family protein
MSDETPDEPVATVALPPSGTGERARNRALRQRQRRTQQAWVTAAAVVLTATIPALGYVGFHAVFNTTQGRSVDAQNDPSKPNYEANVVPTPVLLLAQTNSSGVSALTMLSLAGGDAGGGVLFIPVDTVAAPSSTSSTSSTTSTSAPTRSTTSKPNSGDKTTTLATAFAANGQPELIQLTANVVGLSFEQVVLLNDDALAQFIAPAGPLTIHNPDRLAEIDASGRTKVVFPAGDVILQATDVSRYLALRNSNESDLARLARHQLVWQAWLAAVRSSSNPNVVPGETSSGLGRYVRGLAKGNVQFSSLPVTPQVDAATRNETFVPDTNRIAALTTTFVPLPTPANPGDRVRVRLLSGVGPVDVPALLAIRLVPANAQVVIVGNADRFDYTTTKIVYYDDGFAPGASELQSLLGVGDITKSTTPADSEDITIIIGEDLVNKQGLKITQGGRGG